MATIYFQTQLDSTNKLNADLLDDSSSTNKLVTEVEKTGWDSKYDKPSSGIPSTDMTTAVQTDLAKGASAIQTITSKNVTDALGYTPLDGAKKGAANGVAELGSDGKVPTAQLPSYVDDVIEGYYYNNKFYADAEHTIEITPETGKIYVDLSTNKTYRWGGSAYVEISASLALGETSETAYRGDRGKVAYDHSQTTTGNPHGVTFAQLSDKPTKVSDFQNDSNFSSVSGTNDGTNWSTITIDGTTKNIPINTPGTTDYSQLTNKPQINSIELSGNKSLADLGITSAIEGHHDSTKQDALPSRIFGKYLKSNTYTGVIGWEQAVSDVIMGASVVDENGVAHIDVSDKENISNKTQDISIASTDTQYPTAKATYDADQAVLSVANSKTKTFVASKVTNPVLDSSSDTITLTSSITDIDGVVYTLEDLKKGYSIYIQENDVPNRWSSGLTSSVPTVDLPEGYTQVEYLYNHYGYEFIRTNTPYSGNIDVTIEFMPMSTYGECLMGTRDLVSNPSNMITLFGLSSNKLTYTWKSTTTAQASKLTVGEWYTITYTIRDNATPGAYATFNGATYTFSSAVQNIVNPNNFKWGIYCPNQNDTSWMDSSKVVLSKIRYITIIDRTTGNKIMNLVPCTYSGTPGFYDTVAEAFFTNIGKGWLEAGPVVTPYVTLRKIGAQNVLVPTKTSDLTNDGDGTNPFLTSHQSLSAYRTSADQDVIDSGKQATISDLETIRSNATAGVTANSKLATVTTDNAIARYDGTTGTLQNSNVTVGDSGEITLNNKFELKPFTFSEGEESLAIQSKRTSCHTIAEIQAPNNNAQEATLTVKLNGTIPETSYTPSSFGDFSLTYYDGHPELAIVGASTEGDRLPRFAVAFNDGTTYFDTLAINPILKSDNTIDKRLWVADDIYIGGSSGASIANDSKKVVTEGRTAGSTVGTNSVALGNGNTASGEISVALGGYNSATAYGSTAMGEANTASAYASTAMGAGNTASGAMTMALGNGTIAASLDQVASGKFNVSDANEYYVQIVGNGADTDNRSNAYALDWSGNGRFAGTLYTNCGTDSTGGTAVESTGNKVTSITSSSTDTEFASAKCLYDNIHTDKVTVTMSASNWSSGTYSFETDYPSTTYNVDLEIATSATVAQMKAFGKAMIVGSATQNIVTAIGTVPTVDIPVILTVKRKI